MDAGLDSAEIVSQLRAGHAKDAQTRIGVDVIAGAVGDMSELGIFEAFKVRLAELWQSTVWALHDLKWKM